MTAIYKREIKAYFHTFIGPLFIGATLFLLGIYFSVYNLFAGYSYIGYALSSIVFLFLITIPILTMRILAEERRQKTDQLILTAPVSVAGIVGGKFLALATIFAIPMGITCIYPLILSAFGEVDMGESYLAILGFFLYGLSCIAIGIFVSSLTESQVISAVLTFGILFLGYVMSGITNLISQSGNWLTRLLSAFDMVTPFDQLLNGSLHVASLVYYGSVILLFLIFTVQSIQKRRYQVSVKNLSMSAYSSAVLVICTAFMVLLNVVACQLPSRYTEFDITRDKIYSLSDGTKELLASVTEDVTIYVLVNEKQADTVLDTTLKNYASENSHIKVSYVDPAVNPKFFTNYTDASVTTNSMIVEGSKRSKVIDYSSIYETEIDYTTYSTNVTGYDGEGQLTSAIEYVLSDQMPKIYLTEGHGELSLDTSFQNAIEKANIDYETINLMNYGKIPEDAQCVIINSPTEDLSADDAEKVLSYMENGGNVMLISTYTGKELTNYNRLLDFYGVSVSRGLVLEENAEHYYTNPFYLLPEIEYDTATEDVYGKGGYVFVPFSQGLFYEEQEGITVTTLLSSTEESFIRDDIEENVDYSKQEGDQEGPFALGLLCRKTVGDGSSTALIYASEQLFTKDIDSMVSGNNQKLFIGSLGCMVSESGVSTISIPVKDYQVERLVISRGNVVLLSLITILILPFAFLISGFAVWLTRRKR